MDVEILNTWGREILSVWLLLPLLWFLLKQQDRTNKEYLKAFKDWLKDIELAVGKNVPLSNEATIELVKAELMILLVSSSTERSASPHFILPGLTRG